MDVNLSRVNAMGDYLTDEVYEIQFVSLPEGFTGISKEDINLRCSTFSIPDDPVNYLTVTHRTFSKSQPTHRLNYQQASMSMIETMTPNTFPFLRDWMNRCAVRGTNFIYPPSQRQCEILVYHKRNDKTIAWVTNLKHVQIETKGSTDLSNGESPSAIIPSLTLNFNEKYEGPNVRNLR